MWRRTRGPVADQCGSPGNSTFDIRHRLASTYIWQMPFLRNRHGIVAGVLSDWQWNGIFSFQTGAHWTPFRGGPNSSSRLVPLVPGACDAPTFDPSNCVNQRSDYNLDGEANDRPNAIANNIHATHAQWAGGFNLPENFFSAPCLGCVGNLGRNTFVGPGYWAVDTSIFKTFRVSERYQLQFRAEAFNVFNHTNFQLGGTTGPAEGNNLDNPLFGRRYRKPSQPAIRFEAELLKIPTTPTRASSPAQPFVGFGRRKHCLGL